MSLPANDTLISGSTQALTTYSANWTLLAGAINVGTAGAFPNNTGANSAAFWNADSFPNDQYAQCTFNGNGTANVFIGPSVRASNTGTLTEYALRVNINGNTWQVIKFVSNVFTNISGTTAGSFANGDTIKIQVQGQSPNNIVTAYQNGVVLYSTTDSSAINSGSGGLATTGLGNLSVVKNWQAGSAVASTPLFMYSVRNVLYFI